MLLEVSQQKGATFAKAKSGGDELVSVSEMLSERIGLSFQGAA
jgi:hypothetical protein